MEARQLLEHIWPSTATRLGSETNLLATVVPPSAEHRSSRNELHLSRGWTLSVTASWAPPLLIDAQDVQANTTERSREADTDRLPFGYGDYSPIVLSRWEPERWSGCRSGCAAACGNNKSEDHKRADDANPLHASSPLPRVAAKVLHARARQDVAPLLPSTTLHPAVARLYAAKTPRI